MNNATRTKNVIRNAWSGIFFHTISLILGFVARTVFIRILSSEYLGLNSLFTNILTILSFAELGIGNAIVFTMYKPIANNDTEKLKKLVNFYKKTYRTIGIVVMGIGILIMPLIPFIISDTPNIKESIYLVYFLFLLDTSISYFFSYKTSMITADQKNYIVVSYTYLFKIGQVILQLIILFLTKEYLLYLLLQVLTTLITNLYLARKSEKMYPFIKDLGNKEIAKSEKKDIFKNVKALVIYKFGNIILDGTDSIIISKYLGLVILGLYSNYLLLINAITQIVGQMFNAFIPSVGNLIANDDIVKSKKVFKELFYFTVLVYTVVCIPTYLMFNDFINLWLGKKYLLSNLVVLTIVLHLFINGIQFAGFSFRNASGNFRSFKYAPIISSVINIVVSIILAKYMGLAGVFVGTIVARITTTTWIDPYIVYKNVFKNEKLSKYFLMYCKFVLVTLISFIPCYFIAKLISSSNIFFFIIKGIVLVLISSLVFITLTFKTQEFKDLKNRIRTFIKNRNFRRA